MVGGVRAPELSGAWRVEIGAQFLSGNPGYRLDRDEALSRDFLPHADRLLADAELAGECGSAPRNLLGTFYGFAAAVADRRNRFMLVAIIASRIATCDWLRSSPSLSRKTAAARRYCKSRLPVPLRPC
jgi:hypothetical protein